MIQWRGAGVSGVSTDVVPPPRLGLRPVVGMLGGAWRRCGEQDAKSDDRHQKHWPLAFQKLPPGDSLASLIFAPGDFSGVGCHPHENLPDQVIEHHHAWDSAGAPTFLR